MSRAFCGLRTILKGMSTTQSDSGPRATPMPASPTEAEKIRALPWSIGFGVLSSSVFCVWTVFGSVFLLYLQELGLPKGQIGLLLSVFPFCGIIAPLAAPVVVRLGLKRVCLVTYTARKLVTSLLLLLPVVMAAVGHTGAVVYVAVVILTFAVLRALAETAVYPWSQEYVPDSVRGKYGAVSMVLGTLASVAALSIAGYVVSHGHGLNRFLWLQGAGCTAGLLGTALLFRVPGGAPAQPEPGQATHRNELGVAVRDRNFRRFLYGTAGLAIGGGMLSSFMPLMLVERVGIRPGTVIWLDNATMIGSVAASLLWGWMADRFGSRTALMPGLTLSLALSVFWCSILATGHAAALGIPALAAAGFVGGVATSAITIGSGRLLLAGVVPPDKSAAYTSVYYAWAGLTGGIAPLLAGGIFSATAALPMPTAWTAADPYAILFTLSLFPAVFGWVSFFRTRPDGAVRTRELLRQVVWRVFRLTTLTR